ncbi:MAG: cation:proton antiporter [Parachlamydiaceae bacterium]
METQTFLIQLVLILLAARFAGELVGFFQIPPVIGELLAGILIGPSIFGFVETNSTIQLLAQIGIILLLFEVGLETDLGRLKAAGVSAISVAFIGVLLPLGGGYLVGYYVFNLSLLVSLFIGCTLTATSIGITLRVLKDLGRQSSPEAQIIIGAAVLDDILGIVLLSMLYEFSTSGQVDLWNAVKVVIFITFFLLIAPIAAKYVAEVIRKWEASSKIPGLLPTAIVSLILLFAWIAHQAGAPELLGGFAAGLALSKASFAPFFTPKVSEEFCDRVEDQMRPIIQLFTPIFFVSVGLSLDLTQINWGSSFIWALTGSLVLVAIFGKLLSGFFLIKKSFMEKLIIGTAMIPRGEVGLVFASIGMSTGVLGDGVHASLILIIVVTTLVPPLALRLMYPSNNLEIPTK